jgi:hypothetical protein
MIERIKKIINPENKDLDNMSLNEMIELLTKLNKSLRCLEDEEVRIDGMTASDLVAPTREVQDKVLEYLINNMKNIKEPKAKAAAFYYTLLNLHMFSDGNGRTSRFMYDLISGDLNESNVAYYFHKDSSQTQEQKNQLEEEKGILDISIVNRIPDEILAEQLQFIPSGMLELYPWITVGHTESSPDTDKIIPEEILKQLSEKELRNLDIILRDGYGVSLCPSGLAMLYVIQKKGQLNEWVKYNKQAEEQGIAIPGRFNISIYRHPERIANWNAEDFREVINAGNAIKYARLKSLIDIFAYPEKFINKDTGHIYLNDIIGDQQVIENREEYSR